MSRHGPMQLLIVIGCAFAFSVPVDARSLAAPPGEIWLVTSPADCPGAGGTLFKYEHLMREQASAALKKLSRTARTIETRGRLLEALAELELRRAGGWLMLLFSGHGGLDGGASRVCVGDGNGPGEWLDIDRELLRALPASLAGAVIVLDACSSANVDPHLATIPTTIISASPYFVSTGALFGPTVLASLSAAMDENCNGVFDDDDLFAGVTHRLRATLSFVTLEAWPKLRRNAPSPLPIPVPVESTERCTGTTAAAVAVASRHALPKPVLEQRRRQGDLARGSAKLPELDIDFFVLTGHGAADTVEVLRRLARAAHLEELPGLDARDAAAIATTMTFAEIYQLELTPRWLRIWRLRDRSLVSVVRIEQASDGLPSRVVRSGPALAIPDIRPRYSQARRYLRAVTHPDGVATPCFEPEGQCFVEPIAGRSAGE